MRAVAPGLSFSIWTLGTSASSSISLLTAMRNIGPACGEAGAPNQFLGRLLPVGFHSAFGGDLESYVHALGDIESLNRRALAGELEVTAVSLHAYAYLAERYALLAHGASIGDRYGPRIVARETPPADPRKALAGRLVAVPGEPPPMMCPSMETTGMTPPEADVTKASRAP